MIKKILKLLIPVVALSIGVVGGVFLKPSPNNDSKAENRHTSEGHAPADTGHDNEELHDTPETHATDDTRADSASTSHAESDGHGEHGSGSGNEVAWFDFSRQFFVPLVRQGDESDIIILSMALETDTENLQRLNDQELRLRDIILRQLLIAANTGRFDGNFTTDGRMRGLRKQILTGLQEVYGNTVSAVLIADIARQQE